MPCEKANTNRGGGPNEERGGRGWDPKFVYQKRPDKIFLMVNFVFSPDGHFGLEGVVVVVVVGLQDLHLHWVGREHGS